MDVLAHSLWAGVGVALLSRRMPLSRSTAAAAVTLAVLPDTMQMLPVLVWGLFGGGTFDAIRAYATALPGQEPVLPATVIFISHHLHCVAHSAIVAGALTVSVWWLRGAMWLPLLGWWSHIVIDVFTHSADYYASPVFYPLTERGFDGIAWNTPWFMIVNYLSILTVGFWLFLARRRR